MSGSSATAQSTRAARRRELSRLTHDDIVKAAAGIVEEGGYDALSMRALAERCGVTTTTIYRLVATKEQLLGALADRLLDAVFEPHASVADSWEDEILDVFVTAHRVLRDHPELTEIVAKQNSHSHVGFATAERVLRALRQAGMDGDRAAVAFNALVAYTIGFTQRELNLTTAAMGERWAAVHELSPDDYENVRSFSDALLPRPTEANFEEGLKVIMRGFVEGLDR